MQLRQFRARETPDQFSIQAGFDIAHLDSRPAIAIGDLVYQSQNAAIKVKQGIGAMIARLSYRIER
jgi:hypothetical protein